MHFAFRARVAYAIDFLGTFASTQLADSKLTHTNASLLGTAKKGIKFPAYLTGFLEENEKKQGEHNETNQARYVLCIVIAKLYTEKELERLKRIYDIAELKVFSQTVVSMK